jgi:hypothetical protein
MPSAEPITNEVRSGLGSSDLEKLEVHLDIRNHGLQVLPEDLLDGVLKSELNLDPKHMSLHCN